jgi:single-stranded DNA-binding protein
MKFHNQHHQVQLCGMVATEPLSMLRPDGLAVTKLDLQVRHEEPGSDEKWRLVFRGKLARQALENLQPGMEIAVIGVLHQYQGTDYKTGKTQYREIRVIQFA